MQLPEFLNGNERVNTFILFNFLIQGSLVVMDYYLQFLIPLPLVFFMQGLQEYSSKFYVMTRIKPRSSCIVDKHSKPWATSPAPRELMLKLMQPKYLLGPEDITQWSIVFMALAKNHTSFSSQHHTRRLMTVCN